MYGPAGERMGDLREKPILDVLREFHFRHATGTRTHRETATSPGPRTVMHLRNRILPDNTADSFCDGESGRLRPQPRVAELTESQLGPASTTAKDPSPSAPAAIPEKPPGVSPARPAALRGWRRAARKTQTA